MTEVRKLYDANTDLSSPCGCGRHRTQHEHDHDARNDANSNDAQVLGSQAIESAMVRALFPADGMRRRFLKAVGANTAMAAIASVLPIGAMQALAQDKRPLEKKDLKIGFIPITCATPLILAHPLRYYAAEGLNVEVIKTAGWALIRDKVLNKEYDASHFLAPMPIAITMGVGSNAQPMNVATIQNINGQAITLANKHKNSRDPKQWKGFRFAVPFEFSIHNFLLRYYVAEHGLDPDKDIQIRVVPPPEMVANLRAGNIDGYLGPDPFNQRAVFEEVGFIHLLTKELWDGHPCCSFGAPTAFIKEAPNSFAALFRAVLKGAALARDPKNRKTIAESIAPANYLNQPVSVLEQVLTGRYADGLGNVKNDPSRIDFDPFPWYTMATWILSQMKRWGYIKGDVRWKDLTEQVYLLTDARRHMAALGHKPPAENHKKIIVMGKVFDHNAPDAYVASFAIKRV
ncbi:MAG: nitrate ABC transporter substrate-binding protein [Betaproteobacteria bacterium]|nr:nitrate ABC transporter substrate-binding protein [Betaproteobacteria bacterium]